MKKTSIALFLCLLYMFQFNFSTVLAEPGEGDFNVTAPSAIIMDARTGIVIYDKNINQKNFPASITKVMTALLTLEYAGDNLDERVSFSHNAVFSIPYGSSHIAMDEGETLSIEQAMYALMLESANEVSNALAEHVGGSVEEFAVMMTEKAQSLGAFNTNFMNPHGLHDQNHYTTAYDMALIMKEAIKNPYFVKFISTDRSEIPYTEKNPDPKPLNNTNKLIQPGRYYDENVVGGKTGFTNEAMHTLVTYGKKDNIELITVVMHDESPAMYTDTTAMLEYGFTRFAEAELFDSYTEMVPVVQEIDGEIKELGQVEVRGEKKIQALLPDMVNKESIEVLTTLHGSLDAPVNAGDKIGTLSLMYKDILLDEIELIAQNSVAAVDVEAETDIGSKEAGGLASLLMKFAKTIFLAICVLAAAFVIMIMITRNVYRIYRKRNRKRRGAGRNSRRRRYVVNDTMRRYRHK